MESIQQYSEPTIEDTFALSPLSKRPGEHIPSFRRGNSDLSILGHIPCSSRSHPCQGLNTTAPVHESPSSCSIEETFLMPQIPGGIEPSILDSCIQGVADDAPGNILVEQIVAAKYPRNLSAIVGRPGEKRESTFDHGNMRVENSAPWGTIAIIYMHFCREEASSNVAEKLVARQKPNSTQSLNTRPLPNPTQSLNTKPLCKGNAPQVFAASQASASFFIVGNVRYRREILTERFEHGCAIHPSYRSIVLLSCGKTTGASRMTQEIQ